MELDFVAVSAIVGVLLPLVISLLKNIGNTWNTQVIRIFSLVVAAVAAVIQVGADMGWTELSFSLILESFAVIYTLAQTTYKGLWQDTGIESALAGTMNTG